eukprot:GHVP01021730.1.p1 GENE.GHVP01021730.1~~GHVP01021730.1.p1  ORF type:complete len:369 (+),score=85.17 GHVP01021730.1:28-1107(+)
MSVVFETSVGDLVIDLLTEKCPENCKNFLKLCKVKYYNNKICKKLEKDFMCVWGDEKPTESSCGSSIYELLGDTNTKIKDELHADLRHDSIAVVGMANNERNDVKGDFYITLADQVPHLDEKHTIIGKVQEGVEIIQQLNTAFVDEDSRPIQIIRILHTFILDDPTPDIPDLEKIFPLESPEPIKDEVYEAFGTKESEAEVLENIAKIESKSRALTLALLGDIPEADARPASNVLFICKLNPYTEEEDLQLIFQRFGSIRSCNIIRDWKTGDSLQYGFIEFEEEKACEDAYFKMQDTLVDDRRIHVDWCQSVSSKWSMFKKQGKFQKKEADVAGKGNLRKQNDYIFADEVERKEKKQKI